MGNCPFWDKAGGPRINSLLSKNLNKDFEDFKQVMLQIMVNCSFQGICYILK